MNKSPAQILTIISVCGESEIVFRYNRDAKAVCRFLMARIMRELFPAAEPGLPLQKEAVTSAAAPQREDPVPAAPAGDEFPLPDEVPPPEDDGSFFGIEETVIPPSAPAKVKAEEPRSLPDLFAAKEPVSEPSPRWETSQSQKDGAAEEKIIDRDSQLLWAKLLQQVKEQDRQTFTWLSSGELSEIEEDKIVIAYDQETHLNKVRQPAHIAVIESALKTVFGKAMRFQAVAAERQNISEGTLFNVKEV